MTIISELETVLDVRELVRRAVKYLVLGIVVSVAAFFIPRRVMNIEEVLLIALAAAATFALLDTFAPAIGSASRTGAGLAIGAGLAGW